MVSVELELCERNGCGNYKLEVSKKNAKNHRREKHFGENLGESKDIFNQAEGIKSLEVEVNS